MRVPSPPKGGFERFRVRIRYRDVYTTYRSHFQTSCGPRGFNERSQNADWCTLVEMIKIPDIPTPPLTKGRPQKSVEETVHI